jgi:hypothetical protein
VGKEREHYKGDLANEPESVEALISTLETPTFLRFVTVRYSRERPKEGKPVSWSEPDVKEVDRRTQKAEFSGRYVWMLEPPQ